MGVAGRMWDEGKHPRGSGGKFAKKSVDVSEKHNTGVRGSAAFQPRLLAAKRRALKETVPSQWRTAKVLYDKRQRGEPLSWREEQEVSWASPKKIAEQKRKTGDAVVPRAEASARIREHGPNRSGDHRLGARDLIMRNPRTGKVEAKRLTREVVLSNGRVVAAKRATRNFDMRPTGKRGTPTAAPRHKASDFVLTTDGRLREIAAELGIQLPKRAGRNQIIKLIVGTQ